jgi:phage I-like protein
MKHFTPALFAEAVGVSEDLARKVLGMVYAKKLTAEDFNSVLWRIREQFIRERLWPEVERMKDADLEAVIDGLIADRAKWCGGVPECVSCAETPEALATALADRPAGAWFFTEFGEKGKTYAAGDTIEIQIMRVGKWEHPEYGDVEVTRQTLKEVKKNFDDKVRGIDLAVDENHEEDHKALAWYTELFFKDGDRDRLFARMSLTKLGADKVNNGEYRYFSPEIAFRYTDAETGTEHRNVLIGGGLTNRPFFKGMQPLQMSEGPAPGEPSNQALFFSDSQHMGKFLKLMEKFAEQKTLSKNDVQELEQAYAELPEADHNAKLDAAVEEMKAKSDEGEAPEGDKPKDDKPADNPGGTEGDKPVAAAEGDDDEEDEEEEPADDEEKPAAMSEVFNEVKQDKDGNFVFSADDMEKVKKALTASEREAAKAKQSLRFSETKRALRKLQFSDKNAAGVLLPKDVKPIAKFACQLSEPMAKQFMDIIKNLKRAPDLKKKGSGDDVETGVFNEATRESNEHYQFYREKMHMDDKAATAATKRYYASLKK